MIRKFFLHLAPALFALLAAWPVSAAFTDNGGSDGSRTVSDSITGLMWDKCPVGKNNDLSCSGTASSLTWSAALDTVTTANSSNLRGYGDWRLPNITELESLVDLTRSNPAIDTTAFPNNGNLFWSSTTTPPRSNAFNVRFNTGNVEVSYAKTNTLNVRLVRGGRTFNAFDALGDSTPNAFTFTAQSDVALSSTQTSNSITVAGIDTITRISISGGSYAINGGAYTSADGAAYSGDSVTVQLTASASYGTATTATLTIGGVSGAFVATTLKGDQTLTFGSAPTVVVGGTGSVSAPSSASLTVSYSSTDTSVCTVSGSTVSGVSVGDCTITADQGGNSQYNAATQVSQTFTIGKGSPTVNTWPTAAAISYGSALSAGTLSGGTSSVAGSYAYTSPATTPSVGTANQSVTFTPTDATNYNTVSGSVSVTVNKATPTVNTWPTAAAISYGSALSAATLSGGSAGVAGSYAYTSPATTPSVGTASQSVTFTPTDTTRYNTVSGTVSVAVNKASQTISGFAATPATATVGGSATLSAGGGASGNPLVYTSATTGICTVSGTTVSFSAAGTCSLSADQAGNANYTAAAQTLSITVSAANSGGNQANAPSSVNAGAGQEIYVSGATPVQAEGGSILNIPSISGVVGLTIALSGNPANPAPVTLKIGGKVLTVSTGDPKAQVKLATVSRNGVDVAVLVVSSGAVTVSAQAGQPLLVVGESGVLVSAGEQGGAVKSSANGAGVTTLSVTGGEVILPVNAFSGGNGFAALRDGKLYAGENVELDAAGKAGQVRLGSPSGAAAALGDAIVTVSRAGLSIKATIPNLKGRAARVSSSQDYLELLPELLGAGFSSLGQDGDGVVRINHAGGTLHLLPVGRLLVDTGRADGVTLTAPGHAEVVKSGVVASFAATVSDAALFAAQLTTLDPKAGLTVKETGSLLARFRDTDYLFQPDWNVSRRSAGTSGFMSGETGWLAFRDAAGNLQTLYPRFADLARLGEIARGVDPAARVAANGDGTAEALFQGKRYTLQPDYALGTPPAAHAGQLWWAEDGKVFLRNGDGSAQGFVVR